MEEIGKEFRDRYANLHPLLFLRSKEKCKTLVELFDVLEMVPDEFPIVWDDQERCWMHTDDILQSQKVRKGQ